MPLPAMEANAAMRNPGHIPYANPMRDMLAEKPNSGGWEVITVRGKLHLTNDRCTCSRPALGPDSLTTADMRTMPPGPRSRTHTPKSLNALPMREGVMMITKMMKNVLIASKPLQETSAHNL